MSYWSLKQSYWELKVRNEKLKLEIQEELLRQLKEGCPKCRVQR